MKKSEKKEQKYSDANTFKAYAEEGAGDLNLFPRNSHQILLAWNMLKIKDTNENKWQNWKYLNMQIIKHFVGLY